MSEDVVRLLFESEASSIESGDLNAVHVTGEQELSRPYEYRITLHSRLEGGVPPDAVVDLLRQTAFVQFGVQDALAEVHGIITDVELKPMHELARAEYEAVLRPTLWRLSLSHRSRVFQDVTVADIAKTVLDQHQISFEDRLNESYPTREYVVQYEESDLDFLQRQLEHWGVFYFFEQQQDGEVMILADSNRACESQGQREYWPGETSRSTRGDMITKLSRRFSLRPLGVTLTDYNWRTPSVPPAGEADAEANAGYGAQRYYAEHIKDSDEGNALATVRGQALAVSHETYRGHAITPGLVPGMSFELEGYPVGDLDQAYLITSTTETAEADGSVFTQSFEAIPLRVPFRAQRITAKPKIIGFMHAVVDGEVPGMAAPLDDQGRYKVVMPFDEVGKPGAANASRWVRMAQTSAGSGYGTHFPAHIGIEVVISHLDGDPDRPVIVGTVPNPETASPVDVSDATKSRIKTKSGILIEFEDDG